MHVVFRLIGFLDLWRRSSGEAAMDEEKSTAAGAAAGRSKKRPTKSTKSAPKAAWGKLLSQCSQV